MKLKILNMDAGEKGEITMPKQFNEPVREDLILRAILTIQANNRQRYGADLNSGSASAFLSKRRRKYRGTYGIGQSRTPRMVLSRAGTRFNYRGAFAPQTVGGRRAHPPKASKIWTKKINKIENRKAIRSALSATINTELVKKRGHKIPKEYPFIISDDIQLINKTADLKKTLIKLGFEDELKRSSQKSIRAGKGTLRGRKYKTKKGILLVTGVSDCELMNSAANIPGVEITLIDFANAELLAPGAMPGRATIYTESAIKKLEETKLFTQNFVGQKTEKKINTKNETTKSKTSKSTNNKVTKKINSEVKIEMNTNKDSNKKTEEIKTKENLSTQKTEEVNK